MIKSTFCIIKARLGGDFCLADVITQGLFETVTCITYSDVVTSKSGSNVVYPLSFGVRINTSQKATKKPTCSW